MNLKQRNTQLEEMNRGLSEKIARISNQLAQQPIVVEPVLAQKIVDLRDDAEFFRRRLEESELSLKKLLTSNKLESLDITLVQKKG